MGIRPPSDFTPSRIGNDFPLCELFHLRFGIEFVDDGDIQRLQGPEATSLFTDEKGHAGDMLVDTGTLIWLHAVHGVDPMDMPEFTQWETDIRVIAKTVLEE
jgi:hypothetical protein